ncbi:DUF4179 domain-containing protein [Bacillus sp. JJ722]|uniref:DUF4179 domain-containing protein n=1 Tax=Bacillus sp. JJ722 TaxID=3122973 RepID=UPI002FFEDD99
MNKDFPQMKKEIDQIPVPIEKLDQIIADTITLHGTNQKKINKSYIKRGLCVAVVACIVLIGSAYISPTMASLVAHIPIIGHYFNGNDKGLQAISEHDLALNIDQSVTKKGTTFTVHDAYYDGTRLVIGYSRKSTLPSLESDEFYETLQINGKGMEDLRFSHSGSGYYVNPNYYVGFIEVKPIVKDFPEKFNAKLVFSEYGDKAAKWSFSFQVKSSNDMTVVKSKSSQTRTIVKSEVTFKSLSYGIGGTELAFEAIEDTDYLNKHMDFSIYYQLLTDKGELINSLGATGMGTGENAIKGKERNRYKHMYEPLPEGTKSVTIIPYTIPSNNGEELPKVVKPIEGQSLPFILDQGEIGSINVQKIEQNDSKLTVYFSMNSDFQFDDTLSHNGIWLENKEGSRLYNSEGVYRIKGNQYKEVFKVKENEELFIATYKYPKPVMYEPITVTLP